MGILYTEAEVYDYILQEYILKTRLVETKLSLSSPNTYMGVNRGITNTKPEFVQDEL